MQQSYESQIQELKNQVKQYQSSGELQVAGSKNKVSINEIQL